MAEILRDGSPVQLSLRHVDFGFRGRNSDYELWLSKDGEQKGTDIIVTVNPHGVLTFSDKLGVLLRLMPSHEKKGSVAYVKSEEKAGR
jgi:hypothetical protein